MKSRYYLGIGLGLFHLLIVMLSTFVLSNNNLSWLWIIFFPIDFPISLLTITGLDIMRNMWGDVVWIEVWKNNYYNYWPIFVHGFIGSVWWGLMPIIITKFLKKY